jgi:P-type Ca2+ transporter type 2C
MQREPFQPNESIFARGLGRYIIRIGLVFAIVTILQGRGSANGLIKWAFVGVGKACRRHSLSHRRIEPTQSVIGDPDTWKTLIFTTLCIAQMGHALAVRSVNKLVIKINPFSNPLVVVGYFGHGSIAVGSNLHRSIALV